MITGTFIHMRGIGPVTEQKMRSAGITSWFHLLEGPPPIPFSSRVRAELLEQTLESLKALEEDNIGFFVKRFPTSQHWRILFQYVERVAFFDIETSGLSRYTAEVTVASVLHRGRMHSFVRDENLEGFLDLIENVELLVSFNGNCFDIPFVLDAFRIPELPCPHIDLRWVSYHAGLRGGLKDIEKACGLPPRDEDLQSVDGLEAVLLWNDWRQRGLRASRDRLLRYCESDVRTLAHLTAHIIQDQEALLQPWSSPVCSSG